MRLASYSVLPPDVRLSEGHRGLRRVCGRYAGGKVRPASWRRRKQETRGARSGGRRACCLCPYSEMSGHGRVLQDVADAFLEEGGVNKYSTN